MSLQEKKLRCEFIVHDGSRLKGLAHLFWHDYRGRVFWHGVAQLTDSLRTDPKKSGADAQVVFEDGRSGYVTFAFMSADASGYDEIGFIGLDQLKPTTQA